jgi:hypothetical protein
MRTLTTYDATGRTSKNTAYKAKGSSGTVQKDNGLYYTVLADGRTMTLSYAKVVVGSPTQYYGPVQCTVTNLAGKVEFQGVIKLDDRDDWANKRVEGPGRKMEQLLRNSWNQVIKDVKDNSLRENMSNEVIEKIFTGRDINEACFGFRSQSRLARCGTLSAHKRKGALVTQSAFSNSAARISAGRLIRFRRTTSTTVAVFSRCC